MASGVTKTEAAVMILMDREGGTVGRFVDMGVAWIGPDGEDLFAVGGRWDSTDRVYVDDAREAVEIQVIASQLGLVRAFKEWLLANLTYRHRLAKGASRPQAHRAAWGTEYRPLYRLHAYGGRRSGKSWLCVQAIIALCLAVPGAVAAMVSPSLKRTRELQALINKSLPSQWVRLRKADLVFDFANGSTIEIHTAVGPELKLGPLDIALLNEAQEMAERAALDVRGNLIDSGGLCLYAYNPPRTAKGLWVRTEFEKVQSGQDGNAEVHFLDPEENPHIDQVALRSNNYGEQEYRREILGDMTVPIDKVVFPQFDMRRHVLPSIPLDWTDCTHEMSRTGFGHKALWIGGLDFDRGAGCAHVHGRCYWKPGESRAVLVWHGGTTEREFQEWQLDERLRLCTDTYGREVFGERSSVVFAADASGSWQNSNRNQSRPDSIGTLRAKGWKVVLPDATRQGNPEVLARFDHSRQLLRDDRVYFLASATELIAATRDYPTHTSGEPKRRHPLAHINDARTYAEYRCFAPRPERAAGKGKPEFHLLRKGKRLPW